VLKVTKLRKIALIPLRKKNCSSSGGWLQIFFSKRYKGHRRCPLPADHNLAAEEKALAVS